MASLFQFSIRSLLVAVTIAAVGVAALLNANLWWEGGTWLVALGLLAVGILLCIYRRQEQRAYWLGFVIFGGLYLGLIVITAAIGKYNDLLPSQLSQFAYHWIIPTPGQNQYLPPPAAAGSPLPTTAYSYEVVASASGPYAAPTLSPSPPRIVVPATSVQALYTAAPWTANPHYVPPEKFVSIGHSLWLLLAAAVGGKLCQWICRTQSPRRDPSVKEQPQS